MWLGKLLKTLRPGPMVWLGASVGMAVVRTGPAGGAISAVLALNALIERVLELSQSMRQLHADLATSGVFAKLEEQRMANAFLLQQHGEQEEEEAADELHLAPAEADAHGAPQRSRLVRGHALNAGQQRVDSDVTGEGGDTITEAGSRRASEGGAGPHHEASDEGRGSNQRRRRGWLGWTNKLVWRSVGAATSRVLGLVPRSLRLSRSRSRSGSTDDESESAPAGPEEAEAAREPAPPLTWGGSKKRATRRSARTMHGVGDGGGAWIKRLGALATQQRPVRLTSSSVSTVCRAAPDPKPSGLQQVHEIVGTAHLAFQELHEVVKIDRVQRFLPDLSKKGHEHDGGQQGVPLGVDGRPLPRVNALQQVMHLTENIKQAVTDLLSTAQHLESLDDRMRDRMLDIQSPAWRRSLRKVLLYVVLYTSVTFALIYIARATIKVGMVPVLESLVNSKQLLSQELYDDTVPGCDSSLAAISNYQLKHDEL